MAPAELVPLTIRIPRALYEETRALAKRELSSINREATLALRARVDAKKARGTK